MKQKIYIETSVVSYLVARRSENIVIAAHQASTLDFWGKISDFDTYVSDIVIQEASKGDKTLAQRRSQIIEGFPVLRIDDEVKELARQFLNKLIIPKNAQRMHFISRLQYPMEWI